MYYFDFSQIVKKSLLLVIYVCSCFGIYSNFITLLFLIFIFQNAVNGNYEFQLMTLNLKYMKIFASICRVLVGLVFVLSGFVKAVDPLGSMHKFNDYLIAFGLDEFSYISLPLSFILSTLEFIVGLGLVFNLKPKLSILGAILFMLMFTPLTLYLAITNAVSDCGCFGDFIRFTNWETFWKNIIITFFILILFFLRNKFEPRVSSRGQWALITVFIILISGFELYNYKHLPVFDFRPYKEGVYIPDNMIIPEGAPKDSMITYLYYKKNGETKEFTSENYPWEDTTWTWVDTKTIKVKDGYKPPIHDLNIIELYIDKNKIDNPNDILENILKDKAYSMFIIAYDLSKTDIKGFKKFEKLHKYLTKNNIKTYCLTASSFDDVLKFEKQLKYSLNYYTTDGITLKTIIRANPGLMIIKEGKIIKKWHYVDMPTESKISKIINSN